MPPSAASARESSLALVKGRTPLFWLNERWKADPAKLPAIDAEVEAAASRLLRNKGVLAALFPELAATQGEIESPLLCANRLQHTVHADAAQDGHWFLKADHALPVAGSVKARGGFHEVLAFAEALAAEHGIEGANVVRLISPEARALLARYTVTVGSTGNLGLAIGLISAALGFKAVVHMSTDAKEWKKARLRARGVEVVEHTGDYATAVEAGRQAAESDPYSYFVDDEASHLLFAGYAVAAQELVGQLAEAGRTVDAEHPLFVYLPCGVGGAPGGICYGLRTLLGEHVHCFFVEPVASPCVLVQLASGGAEPLSVYDVGLDNRTEADGLAVGQASLLVCERIADRVSGVITVSDEQLYAALLLMKHAQGIDLEPSACAGVMGPLSLLRTAAGRDYVVRRGLQDKLHNATHVIWTTGGSLVPPAEHERFESIARRMCGPDAALNDFFPPRSNHATPALRNFQ
ncbi:MAG: D-serine ammonia-lyase [Xenophilus sp.]